MMTWALEIKVATNGMGSDGSESFATFSRDEAFAGRTATADADVRFDEGGIVVERDVVWDLEENLHPLSPFQTDMKILSGIALDNMICSKLGWKALFVNARWR